MTVKSLLRAVRTGGRRATDRVLHVFRHRAACAAARQSGVQSILVVCHGNICRSPFAEAVLRRDLGGTSVNVLSAGFIGAGRQPPANALLAAAGRGIEMADHRSQLLEPELVRTADLILTMDARQARAIRERFGKLQAQVVLLGDFDSGSPNQRTILDPVDMPVDVFDSVYQRIERCVAVLASTMLGAPDSATPPPR
jgi:low molecular weight protein-tyrosine phosphatase